MMYQTVIALLQAALMMLVAAQGPNVPAQTRVQAIQVAQQAISIATAALSKPNTNIPHNSIRAGNGLIAVSHIDGSGIYQIFTISPDGTKRTQITHNTFNSVHPDWSPDGKHIAYYSEQSSGTHTHVMNADGSGDHALTSSSDQPANFLPRWSPDGTMIAYTAGPPASDATVLPRVHIWVMRADGTEKRQLTSGDFMDFGSTWSPDGKYIAFSSSRNGGFFQIWRMNADGTNLVQLTHSSTDSSTGFAIEHKVPVWSPDGKYIAYWHGIEGDHLSAGTRNHTAESTATDWYIFHSWHIWLMNADGSNQHQLTQGDDPAWAPDSTMILNPTLPIYGSNPKPTGLGEPVGVGATNVDGTNRHMLFTVPGGGPSGFSWQRI